MAQYTPYVTLDPQNCGLAIVSGLGRGDKLAHNIDPQCFAKAQAVFDELMREFDAEEGWFKNIGQGPYSCPNRAALTLSITAFQRGVWADKLKEHGWREVAAFNNNKKTGSGPCFIYFMARKGSEYESN